MSNDLISRSALVQHAFTAEFNGKPIDVVALVDVDNAPAVEAFTENDKALAYCEGYVRGSHEAYIRPQGEWIRKEDIIHLLESWADGYSYIEIPTETAIKEIKELGDEQND